MKSKTSELEWHLNRMGMSSEVMHDFLKTIGVSNRFKGIYHFNHLPSPSLYTSGHHILIFNVGHHFVTLYICPQYLYYIDSLGQSIFQEKVQDFCNFFSSRDFFFNPSQIQSIFSSHCGLYAILFTSFWDKTLRGKDLPRLRFVHSNLIKNDKKCVTYLKKNFLCPV